MIFYIYKDIDRQWRWKLKSTQGNTVAYSGEGFMNKQDAKNMINNMVSILTNTKILEG